MPPCPDKLIMAFLSASIHISRLSPQTMVSSRPLIVEAWVLSHSSPCAIFREHWDWFFSGYSRYLTFPIAVHVQFFVDTGTGFLRVLQVFDFSADSSGCTVEGVGLRPLACWDCGFGSRRVHWMAVSLDCLSLRWADQSSRGVLPSVVSLSVIMKPR